MTRMVRYAFFDAIGKRGRAELLMGLIITAITALVFTLLISVLRDIDSITSDVLHASRPVLTTLRAERENNNVFGAEDLTKLRQWAQENSDSVKGLTFLKTGIDYHLWTRSEHGNDISLYTMAAVAHDDYLFSPDSGFQLQGTPFQPDTSQWSFQVMVNKKFLKKYYESESDIAVTPDLLAKLTIPFELVEFAETVAQPSKPVAHQTSIPVNAIFDIPEKPYPDILVNDDIVRALELGGETLHAPFLSQFHDRERKKLTAGQFTRHQNGIFQYTDENGNSVQVTQAKDKTLILKEKQKTNKPSGYNIALIWLEGFDHTEFIRAVREELREQDIIIEPVQEGTLAKTAISLQQTTQYNVMIGGGGIIALSSVCVALFGIGFLQKKKGDIGLLTSQGVSAIKLAMLYIIELLLVVVASLAVALVAAAILAPIMKPALIEFLLQGVNAQDAEFLRPKTFGLDFRDAVLTILAVFLASLVAWIPTIIGVSRVTPLEQLQTKL